MWCEAFMDCMDIFLKSVWIVGGATVIVWGSRVGGAYCSCVSVGKGRQLQFARIGIWAVCGEGDSGSVCVNAGSEEGTDEDF